VPFDDEHVCDSDNHPGAEQDPEVGSPSSAAGVIGCEYASIFAALGIEVHLNRRTAPRSCRTSIGRS